MPRMALEPALGMSADAILEPHTEHKTRLFFVCIAVGTTNEQIPRQAPRSGRHVELRLVAP